jgi:hypothetical protein
VCSICTSALVLACWLILTIVATAIACHCTTRQGTSIMVAEQHLGNRYVESSCSGGAGIPLVRGLSSVPAPLALRSGLLRGLLPRLVGGGAG